MKHPNSYSPPRSPLEVEPPKRPPRPLQLKIGIGLLAFEMIGSFLLTTFHVWYLKQAHPTENYSHVLVGVFGLPLFEAPLLWLVARGFNWARYVAAALLALGLFSYVASLSPSQISSTPPFELARDWISYGLMVLGVASLFTPRASAWFHEVRAAQ